VLLLRADALAELGGLDERFFLYAEETDWQKRARDHGWDIAVADVRAEHIGAGTGGDPTVRETYFHGSMERFVRKHHGILGWAGFRAALIAGSAARAVVLPGDRGARARFRRHLYLSGPTRLERRQRPQRRPVTAPAVGASPTTGQRLDGLRVAQVVCGDGFAGVERYVATVAKGLARRGAEVVVVGGDPMAMPAELGLARNDPAGLLRWRPGSNLAEVAAALSTERVDLVHAHMTDADLVALITGLLRGVPVVSTQHFAHRRGSSPAARIVGRWIDSRLAAQIAISEYVAYHTGTATDVVPSGVPTVDRTIPSAGRERAVLVAQRFEAEKDTAVALDAWARTDAARSGSRLWLAGDGSLAGDLRARADRLGIADSVEFLGRRSDIAELMGRAAVFLAPTPIEGLGLAVVEAMASALPVVAAAAGGHLETAGAVTPELLFPPGDAAAAARQVDALLSDPGRRDRVGLALQEFQCKHFTIDRQLEMITDIYRRVLVPEAGRTR
jgi:glycosyltransferase involved in cell wall biosynthesis